MWKTAISPQAQLLMLGPPLFLLQGPQPMLSPPELASAVLPVGPYVHKQSFSEICLETSQATHFFLSD